MRKGINLDGVDPARREETLRRVQILESYIALEAPSRADNEAAAAEAGLSPSHFDVLVRAWKAFGRASALPGARVSGARAGRQQLDPARAEIIDRTVREHAGASFRSVTRAVHDALERGGHPPLSRTTVSRRVRRGLTESGDFPRVADGAAIILTSVHLDAPISSERRTFLPTLTLVTSLPSRHVAGWRLTSESMDAAGMRSLLVAGLSAMPSSDRLAIGRDGPPTIVATARSEPGWGQLVRDVERGGWRIVKPPLSDPQMARAMFGARIAEIGIRARRTDGRPAEQADGRTLQDLERVLALTLPPASFGDEITNDLASYLSSRLSEF